MEDLEREKERIRIEITRSEEGIKYNYQNLVHLLSFRNLIGIIIDEVSTTTTVVGRLFSLGKDFVAKRKKKKKEKKEKQEKQEQREIIPEEQAE